MPVDPRAPPQDWRTELRRTAAAQWLALAVITAAATWIRWRMIDGPMRYDESFTVVSYVSRGILHVLANYSLPNNHVFHSLLVYIVSLFGGLAPAVVRLPALLAGIAQVPALFVVFTRVATPTAGLLAAAMAAASSVLVGYSVNARGYTIAGLLAVAAVGVAVEQRRPEPDRRGVLALGVIAAFGVWTVPVFAYPWAAVLLWLLAPNGGRPFGRRFTDATIAGVTSIAGAGLLYAPVLVVSGPSALFANRFVTPDAWPVFFERLPAFLRDVGAMWTANAPLPIVVAAIVGFFFALLHGRIPGIRSLAWSVVVAVAVLFVAQHAIPPARAWLVFLPLVLGVVASGLTAGVDVLVRGVKRAASTTGRPRVADTIAALAVVAVAVWLVLATQAGPSPVSREDPGLPHAEEITRDLVGRFKHADFLAAAIPATAPLRYYFLLYGLPRDAQARPDVLPEAIYVVTAFDQTVEEVLASVDVQTDGARRLLSTYPTGRLWQVAIEPSGGGVSAVASTRGRT